MWGSTFGRIGASNRHHRSLHFHLRVGARPARCEPPGTGCGNGRRARAAAMRYGCWRGEPFEGCGPRRGEARAGPGSRWRCGSSALRLVLGPRAIKRDEPQGRQRGATNPRACCGASRRGGEKTTRTEQDVGAWKPRSEGERAASAERSPGVDAAGARRRGDQRARPGEEEPAERSERTVYVATGSSGVASALKTKPRSRGSIVRTSVRAGGSLAKTPGVRAGDGPRPRGFAGKSNDRHATASAGAPPLPTAAVSPTALKTRLTSRELTDPATGLESHSRSSL